MMKALILVDIQNDFLPGGALAVPRGDQIIPVVNNLMPYFTLVVATQDWHPPDHVSFAANHPGKKVGDLITADGLPQILWPVHCVQNSRGAELSAGLDSQRINHTIRKGADARIDSYSGFYDNGHRRSTGLADLLRSRDVRNVYITGLASDYCVKFTALDAIAEGFTVHLIQDACRGVNLHPGDVDRAIQEIRNAGGRVIRSDDLEKSSSED
jgi:nicotinamidase/pyrazinamidase